MTRTQEVTRGVGEWGGKVIDKLPTGNDPPVKIVPNKTLLL